MIRLLKFDSLDGVRKQLKAIGVDNAALRLMEGKGVCYGVLIRNCKFYHANILKQEALSLGIDCAVQKDVVTAKVDKSDCLILGDVKRLYKLSEKLKGQNFEFLREIGIELERHLNGVTKGDFIFRFKGREISLKDKFLIMGILNVTPDSFSDGGDYLDVDKALRHVEEMIEEGADIVDVGGESTRPFAEPVSLDEELRRVLPVIEAMKKEFPEIVVSIDTYKSKVAQEALDRGVEIVNDISGLGFDERLIEVLSGSDCGIVEMHIKGTPKNMQKNPHYDDVVSEINEKFGEILDKLKGAGIDENRVVLDPGIGFGKRFEHNLEILNNIEAFKVWGRPILVGTSRKSFIGGVLDIKNPKERLFGTIASNVVAFVKGAHIFRVHDVKAHKEALQLAGAILKEKINPSSQQS